MVFVDLVFKVHRGLIAERAVEPHPVVKDFDPVEDGSVGLGPRGEVPTMDQFAFQGAPEAFHGGVVVTVGAAVHAANRSGLGQRLPVSLTSVLNAPVGVMQQPRRPMRVVGLNRLRLDEYPIEAMREALVNAVAHRPIRNAGHKIMLEVFADCVVVSSPGLPPSPITLANLGKGKYHPCSRNPVLAQCLS